MLIALGLHLVLGPDPGLGDRFDCTVYVVETKSGTLLLDSGAGRDTTNLARYLGEAALPLPIVGILRTHAHADHSGGAAWLAEAFSAHVLAGEATAWIVTTGDETAMSLDRAKCAGIYPIDYRFRPCPVQSVSAPSDVLRFGDVLVRIIPTPGHSADHCSYLVETSAWRGLIAGDFLFDGGKIILQDTWDCDVAQSCASIRQLSTLGFDLFLPGHGRYSLEQGRQHVERAMQRINKLLVPELYI
jgi:glyoxylase-like metal-dependent hydrolase (beta-lactamase superfamily II)